jgi:hypothetical protein
MKTFKTFLNENENDETYTNPLLNGGCVGVAHNLKHKNPHAEYVVVSSKKDDPSGAIHAGIKMNGKYYDARGEIPEEKFKKTL